MDMRAKDVARAEVFRANWSEWTPASKSDLKLFQQHGRCQESGLIRSRYKACGAQGSITHGRPLKDQPVVVSLDPFIGRPESPPTFAVVPRKRGEEGWQWPSEHGLILNFPGVDSPAMWAARRHGCRLLNSTVAQRSILYSADALCELLPHCGNGLCRTAHIESLGFGTVFDPQTNKWKHQAALLSPESIVKLLTCIQVKVQSCAIIGPWHHVQGSLRLGNFGWQIPISTLLQQVDKLGKGGLALLQEIRKNLDVDDALDFDEHAAQEVWDLHNASSELLATVAASNETLPKLLLQALMQSPSGKVPPVTAKVQAPRLLF